MWSFIFIFLAHEHITVFGESLYTVADIFSKVAHKIRSVVFLLLKNALDGLSESARCMGLTKIMNIHNLNYCHMAVLAVTHYNALLY